jgi:hypothetical protein
LSGERIFFIVPVRLAASYLQLELTAGSSRRSGADSAAEIFIPPFPRLITINLQIGIGSVDTLRLCRDARMTRIDCGIPSTSRNDDQQANSMNLMLFLDI